MEIYDFSVRSTPRAKPDAGIFDDPAVTVCVNEDWIPLISGLLAVLLQPEYWTGDPIDAQREISALYAALMGDTGDCALNAVQDIRIKPGTDCILQAYIAGEWLDKADLSSCAESVNRPTEGQPGSEYGDPDPVQTGTCRSLVLTVPAAGEVLVPFRVSPEDTVTVVVLDGAWTSGRNAPLNVWYCGGDPPARYVLGTCTGTSDANNGDLIATELEHEVIGLYDGNYVFPGASGYQLPGAWSDSDLVLMMNDSDRSDNAGSLRVKVTVCSGGWCRDSLGAAGQDGWGIVSGGRGSYSGGSFVHSDGSGSFYGRGVDVDIAFTAVPLDDVTVHFNVSPGATDPAADNPRLIVRAYNSGVQVHREDFEDLVAGDGQVKFSPVGGVNVDRVYINLIANQNGATSFDGYAAITGIRTTGTGTNPFGVNNCV